MPYSQETLDELELLKLFPLSSSMEGIKIHTNASPTTIAAAQRLFERGLITQPDGGYLTPFGHEAAELWDKLLSILSSDKG